MSQENGVTIFFGLILLCKQYQNQNQTKNISVSLYLLGDRSQELGWDTLFICLDKFRNPKLHVQNRSDMK